MRILGSNVLVLLIIIYETLSNPVVDGGLLFCTACDISCMVIGLSASRWWTWGVVGSQAAWRGGVTTLAGKNKSCRTWHFPWNVFLPSLSGSRLLLGSYSGCLELFVPNCPVEGGFPI